MNNSLRRRVAAVATAATVGGLLLPFLAAGSASAAPLPAGSTLTANPSPYYASANAAGSTANSVTVIGNFTDASGVTTATYPNSVFVKAVSGPDAAAGTVFPCSVTPGAGVNYIVSCPFTPTGGAGSGTDSLRIFFDPSATTTGNGNYATAATTPQAVANLSVAGPLTTVTLTQNISAAQGAYGEYTATATDKDGKPVPGAGITISGTELNTAPADMSIVVPSGKPSEGYMSTAAPITPVTPGTTGTAAPVTVTTSAGNSSLATTPAGTARFSVASRVPGAFNLTGSSVSPAGASTTSTMTVNNGLANDVTTVTAAPSTLRAFAADFASVTLTLRNAQGNPVPNVLAKIAVTGTNVGAIPVYGPATGLSDGNGNLTATYPTSATVGNDTVTAWVNQTKNPPSTPNLDAGEPSAITTVTTATFVTGTAVTSPSTYNVPLNTKTATITYTVASGGVPLVNQNVTFANTAAAKITLGANSAVTDASGNVSVTVNNANPIDGDTASVIAKVGTNTLTTASSTAAVVNYQASVVMGYNVRVTPIANTATAKAAVSFSASVTDQFGTPVTGVNYSWSLTSTRGNTATSTGTSSTFGYTDGGGANVASTDVVTVVVSTAPAGTVTVYGTAYANQYFITTAVTATQANIDFNTGGSYQPGAGVPAPLIPQGFTKSLAGPVAVTKDPTTTFTPTTTAVHVLLTDAANNRLFGKSVTFSSSGVGVFTDFFGGSSTTSTSAPVADGYATTSRDFNYKGLSNASVANFATVFVRSTQSGTQTITATVDGISSSVTITYTGQFVGLTPVRVVDTRNGQGAISAGNGSSAGPIAPNTFYNFNYSAAGMPTGSYAAYVFNVTAINPSGVGNLRIAPGAGTGGNVVPATSVINYQPGQTVANQVIITNPATAALGQDSLLLYSDTASTNVAIDLVGYYPTSAGINNTPPTRIADTRNGAGPVAAGGSSSFQVSGTAGIPVTGAKAVALNVTVVNPANLGNLRIYADGAAVPTTSNINYIPGQDKSAFVIVNLPANGKIDVYSDGTAVNVAVDAYAYYATATNIVTQNPVRILDSRTNSGTLAAGGSSDVQVGGMGGVPVGAQAVLVSVTSIHTNGSTGVGFLRAYPSGGAVPNYSTLNYVSPTADVANFAIVKLGANGAITLNTQGSPTDFAVDVLGYVPAGV